MKVKISLILITILILSHWTFAYPPAVGILGKAQNCLVCHTNNGPWKDNAQTIIDILDKETKESLKQTDESFLIRVKRGEMKTILTVIGSSGDGGTEVPYRNAWLYVYPESIKSTTLSKFAPGWDVNLPMACRVVGDQLEGYDHATITALPMTIRPTDAAGDTEVQLQVMLTTGATVKGKPKEGLIGSYFERQVKLRVLE